VRRMKNQTNNKSKEFKTLEEERDYWEARGPLAPGARGKISKPVAKEKRSSFLSVRLSGEELTQLRNLAQKYDLGPSTFAQRVLLELIKQTGTLEKTKNSEAAKTILFEELFDSSTLKVSARSREQILSLVSSYLTGGPANPDSIMVDRSRLRQCFEMSARFMALFAETVNPDLKVITPFDQDYKEIKAAKESKEPYKHTEGQT
jgi:hypothetical protein